jgi:hypothetical protein
MTPDSYSIVVIVPVEPGQKTVTRPFLIPDFSVAFVTLSVISSVISIVSLNPFVLRTKVSVKIFPLSIS